MYPLTRDELERLWARIDHTAGPNECWPWLGGKGALGKYGQVWINHRNVQPHRVVCYLMHGDLGSMNALHHCDNDSCCNPFHLYPGTQKRNVQDAIERGRYRCGGDGKFGESNSNSRYSDEQITRIHELLKTSMTQREIAVEVSCTQRLVSQIYRGQAHANLERVPERPNKLAGKDPEFVAQVMALHRLGLGPYQIAKRLPIQPKSARLMIQRVLSAAAVEPEHQEPAF